MVARGQGGREKGRAEADFYEADNGVCNLNLKQKEGKKSYRVRFKPNAMFPLCGSSVFVEMEDAIRTIAYGMFLHPVSLY